MPSETVNLDSLDGHAFERVCARMFERAGWGDVTHIGGVADRGRDLIIDTVDGKKIVVECKLYGSGATVGRPIVQKLHSAVIDSKADSGIIVTTGRFSKAAMAYAAELAHTHPIDLFDMHKIMELAHKAGIELETGRMQKIYTYPGLGRQAVEACIRPHLDDLESHPAPAADIMRVGEMHANVRAMYFVSVSIQQTFSTTVGVIHQIDVNDEHHMFDGQGDLDESGSVGFFGSPLVDVGTLPEHDYPKDGFVLNDTILRDRITRAMLDMYAKRVTYRGRNNTTYHKLCVPTARNIRIDSLRQVYVPRYGVTVVALGREYACDMEYNGSKTRLLDRTWERCHCCRRTAALLCNECGRVAHTSWVWSHGHRCRECKKTVCGLCVWNTRRFLVFNNRFCSDCRPDNAKRDAK